MNSLSNPAGARPEISVEPLAYCEAPVHGPSPERVSPSVSAEAARLEVETRERSLREAGQREGESKARTTYQQELQQVRAEITSALNGFAKERADYFRQVESEIVQLSLSIARKVLHREAQVDPLLLAGLVRVALEQVEANSEVLVSVEPGRAPEWQAYFTAHLDPAEVPRVVEDPALAPGRCLVQTRLGKTELGLEVQLKEIEQGLMDLLALRPGDRDARS